jgi:hypothetical protein
VTPNADTVGYLCAICGVRVWWKDAFPTRHGLLCSICDAWLKEVSAAPPIGSSGAS